MLRQPLDARVIEAIREATATDEVLGDAFFQRQIAARIKRKVQLTPQGSGSKDASVSRPARAASRGGQRRRVS